MEGNNRFTIKLFVLFVVFQGISALHNFEPRRQFGSFPTRQRLFPRRFDPFPQRLQSDPSSLLSRGRSPARFIDVPQRRVLGASTQRLALTRQRSHLANKWFRRSPRLSEVSVRPPPRINDVSIRQTPRLSEVSVPSVRRTPISRRGTSSTLRDSQKSIRRDISVVQDQRRRVGARISQVPVLQNRNSDTNNRPIKVQPVQSGLLTQVKPLQSRLSPQVISRPPLNGPPTLVQTRVRKLPGGPQETVVPVRKSVNPVQYPILPKVVNRQRVSSLSQQQPLVMIKPSYQTQNVPVPGSPLVSLRPVTRIQQAPISNSQRIPIQTRPLSNAQVRIATRDSDTVSISLRNKVSPVTMVQKQPYSVIQTNPRVEAIQTPSATNVSQQQIPAVNIQPLVRPLQPNSKLTVGAQPNAGLVPVQSNPAILNVPPSNPADSLIASQTAVYMPSPQNTLIAPAPALGSNGIITQAVSVSDPLQSQTIGNGQDQLQAQPSGAKIQQSPGSSTNTLHQDLVEAFTTVIESLLVPQISGGQAGIPGQSITSNNLPDQAIASNVNGVPGVPSQPIGNTGVPQTVVQQTYPQPAVINQYTPQQMPGAVTMQGVNMQGAVTMQGNPYNQFGYMPGFGYMNPWMSSAAMQEMMYGDTTDPPDPVVTTTVAPVNVSDDNVIDNVTITPVVLDTNVSLTENIGLEISTASNTGEALQITTESAQAAKENTLNIETPLDNIVNKDIPSKGGERILTASVEINADKGHVEMKKIGKLDVKMETGGVEPGTVKIDGVTEHKPTKVIETKINTETALDSTANINIINVDTAKDVKAKVKASNKDLVESINGVAKEKPAVVTVVEKKKKVIDTNQVDKNNADIGNALKKDTSKLDKNVHVKVKVKPAIKEKGNGGQYVIAASKLSKKVDKNKQLILDIASLIRNSKLDLGKLSNIVTGKKEPVVIKPLPERFPTMKQLGIKLTSPGKKVSPKRKVRPTKPTNEYTVVPKETPTVPPVPPKVDFVNNITIPTLIPKGLVFTRQPEIYRTIRTILKHNPKALIKAITTDPTPKYGSTKPAQGSSVTNLIDKTNDGSSPALVSILNELTKTPTPKVTSPTHEVPVLANVVDQKVEQKLITDDTTKSNSVENKKAEEMTTESNNALHKQLIDLNVTKDESAADMAKYLNDPAFVDLLKGILQNMASKQEVTTPGYYYHEPETTTFYPEFTTTTDIPTTTEEYEAEDFITEAP